MLGRRPVPVLMGLWDLDVRQVSFSLLIEEPKGVFLSPSSDASRLRPSGVQPSLSQRGPLRVSRRVRVSVGLERTVL